MKINVTIIPTNLVTNSLLSLFVLSYKVKIIVKFEYVGGLVTRNSFAFCL